MKNKVIILFLVVVLVGLGLSFILRPTIHNANIEDIQAINGFGDVLSERVVLYTNEHKNYTVDDIINVEGIGPKKLIKLKLRYR